MKKHIPSLLWCLPWGSHSVSLASSWSARRLGLIDVRHGQRVRHGCFGSRNRRCPGHTDEPRHIGKTNPIDWKWGVLLLREFEPGPVQIDVEKPGFKAHHSSGGRRRRQQTVRIDLAMQVGDVSQSIEVTERRPCCSRRPPHWGKWLRSEKQMSCH